MVGSALSTCTGNGAQYHLLKNNCLCIENAELLAFSPYLLLAPLCSLKEALSSAATYAYGESKSFVVLVSQPFLNHFKECIVYGRRAHLFCDHADNGLLLQISRQVQCLMAV
jgi:hypothetical protein